MFASFRGLFFLQKKKKKKAEREGMKFNDKLEVPGPYVRSQILQGRVRKSTFLSIALGVEFNKVS